MIFSKGSKFKHQVSRVALAVLAACVPATVFAEAPSEARRAAFANQARDGVLMNVNGQIITMDDLRQETMRYVPEIQRSATSQSDFQKKISDLLGSALQSLGDKYLLVSAFDDSGAVMDENYIEQHINAIIEQDFEGDRAKYLQMLRKNGSNPLADKRRMMERIKASSWDERMIQPALGEISPAKVKAEYEARIAEFTQDAAVEYAQIVLFAGASETDKQVEEIAARLKKQLDSGETEFEQAAKFFSRDDYRSNGGYVGWKPIADLSEQIVPALQKIKDGTVSEVITLDAPSGKIFVLLKRIAYREAGVIPLKDVRAQIENQLRNERIRQLRAEKMAELRDDYYIRRY